MISDDDLRAAILSAMGDLGVAEATAIADQLPPRMKADATKVRQHLDRLEAKGVVRRVAGFVLSEEGREILLAITKLRNAFPGPGRKASLPGSNGEAKAEE